MTDQTTSQNAFNFADLSDVSTELQSKLAVRRTSGVAEKIAEVVAVFKAALAAGVKSMTLSQLEVACAPSRMNVELPSSATVRKYITGAIADGTLVKASRQSYGLTGEVEAWVPTPAELQEDDAPETGGDPVTNPADQAAEDDPLAGIA